MATFNVISKSLSFTTPYPTKQQLPISPLFLRSPEIRFSDELFRRKMRMRGVSVVTRAGPPSSSQYLFAFVFPLSLLAITAFTAFRIGNKLDQKFLEELAMNEAIREAEEEDEDGEDIVIPRKEEPALPRTRNRPKREV